MTAQEFEEIETELDEQIIDEQELNEYLENLGRGIYLD